MDICIKNLSNALVSLKECNLKYEENKTSDLAVFLEDACIKRFEYTLEIARKMMKKILKKIYAHPEEELTVNNIFRFMQGYDFISDWERWRNYYEKRNNTAHEYNLEKSRELVSIIPQFIQDTEELIDNINRKLN